MQSTKTQAPIIVWALGLSAAILVLFFIAAPKAHADYVAGNIISDSIFLDANSMNASEIQSFLVEKNSGLKNMTFTLSCYGAESKERQWYTAAGATCDTPIPASQVIYYASQIYGVNPRVILTTMQKEQSLTTATNPTDWQLSQAMGYACPTSGSCNASSNFAYQIDSGTWALRYHFERARGNLTWWTTSTTWTCGTEKNLYAPSLYPNQNVRFYDTNGTHYATVYIQNAATSSMYCYTPHAYNNPQGLYGRSVYGTTGLYYSGSYNFVYYYELWFGSSVNAPPSNVYFPDGAYRLTGKASGRMLDVAGGKSANGTPAQIYDSNGTTAQKWQINRDTDGYYTFTSSASGKYLDVSGGSTISGATVQIWAGNGSCAQKWSIMEVKGYYHLLNKCSGFALDVRGAATSNGARLQTWNKNSTGAQLWSFTSAEQSSIKNGLYQIATSANTALDLTGGTLTSGTKVIINTSNSSTTQRWQIERQADGLYLVRNPMSGRYLDVVNASSVSGAEIQLYAKNITCAQRWVISGNNTAGYTLLSACSGKAIDVQNAAISVSGTKVQIYDSNGSGAQKWYITKTAAGPPSGSYSVLTTGGKALEIAGGSTTAGTKVQTWSRNGTGSQLWKITLLGDGFYTVQNTASGRYLDVRGGLITTQTPIHIWNSNETCAQKWDISENTDGTFRLLTACTPSLVLDVANGAVGSNGTSVQLWSTNGSGSQSFSLALP